MFADSFLSDRSPYPGAKRPYKKKLPHTKAHVCPIFLFCIYLLRNRTRRTLGCGDLDILVRTNAATRDRSVRGCLHLCVMSV